MSRAQTDVAITPDTPLRLRDAVAIAFPYGGMTVSGLRREASRDRLQIEKIAGKQFVTLQAINEMRAKCRVEPKEPASICASATDVRPFGLSSTERMKSAQVACQMTAEALKKRSPNTSPESIGPTGEVVTLQKSPLPTC
jgi:hypothetical protein